jgi:hypothetical protein
MYTSREADRYRESERERGTREEVMRRGRQGEEGLKNTRRTRVL